MIYTDANVIIRLVEGTQAVRAPIEARLQPLRGTAGFLATSRLSRLECPSTQPQSELLMAFLSARQYPAPAAHSLAGLSPPSFHR
jgi:hypothetical protein